MALREFTGEIDEPVQLAQAMPSSPQVREFIGELDEPAPPPRQVGGVEAFKRFGTMASASTVRALGILAAPAVMVIDKIGGHQDALTDSFFTTLDDIVIANQEVHALQADEELTAGGKVGAVVGGVAPQLALTLATGGAGAGIQATSLAGRLAAGASAVAPGAAVYGTQRAGEVVERGGSLEEAAQAGLVSAGTMAAGGAIPIGVSGQALQRLGIQNAAARGAIGAASGAAIGVPTNIAAAAVENAALPDRAEFDELRQDPLSAENIIAGGVMGGVFGGVHGVAGAPQGAARGRVEPGMEPRAEPTFRETENAPEIAETAEVPLGEQPAVGAEVRGRDTEGGQVTPESEAPIEAPAESAQAKPEAAPEVIAEPPPIAPEPTPTVRETQAENRQTLQRELGIEPDDIVAARGQPFKNEGNAQRAAEAAGPNYAVETVPTGFVVRKKVDEQLPKGAADETLQRQDADDEGRGTLERGQADRPEARLEGGIEGRLEAGSRTVAEDAQARIERKIDQLGEVVDEFAGQYKKGMTEFNAKRVARERQAKRPELDYTVVETPEFGPDRFKVVGRAKPIEARPERRSDIETRKRIAEMTPDEMRHALTQDELTGLKNRRAYAEDDKLPIQVHVDMDSLKWINDTLGHDKGDEALRKIGETIKTVTPNGYRMGGDEFVIQAKSRDEAAQIVAQIRDALAKETIVGAGQRMTGIPFSHGWGKTRDAAEAMLQRTKKERAETGERAERGEKPKNVEAVDDFKNAMGDLADLVSKGTRENLIPDNRKLMPILKRLFDATVRMGMQRFKDAARYVMDQIRKRFGDDVAKQVRKVASEDEMRRVHGEAGLKQKEEDGNATPENMVVEPSTPATRINVRQKLNALKKLLHEGKIGEGRFINEVEWLLDELSSAHKAKVTKEIFRERTRGVEWVRERILRAKRLGEITEESAEFADWLLRNNPHLANELGISIKSPPEHGDASGMYNRFGKLIVLFKNSESDTTAVHEILHHSERMMPPDVQSAIIEEWGLAVKKAIGNSDSPERKEALAQLVSSTFLDSARKITLDNFRKGVLSVENDYQLYNPSEYWAVNATKILARRHSADSWIAKAKQWLKEFIEKAKGAFGLRSDAPILVGLRNVLEGDGDFQSKKMLSEKSVVYKNIDDDSGRKERKATEKAEKSAKEFAEKDEKKAMEEAYTPDSIDTGQWGYFQRVGDAVINHIQDSFRRLKLAERATGKKISVEESAYAQEQLMHSRTEERLKDVMRDMDSVGKIAIERDLSTDQVRQFLYARHAPEANKYIREIDPENQSGSGMSDDKAAKILSEFTPEQRKALDEIGDVIESMNQRKLDLMVESGLISKKEAEIWNKRYKHYVSLKDADEDAIFGTERLGVGQGLDIRGKESKGRTGRGTEADDPLSATFREAMRAAIRAGKNKVAQNFVKIAMGNDMPGVWEVIDESNMPKKRVIQVRKIKGQSPDDKTIDWVEVETGDARAHDGDYEKRVISVVDKNALYRDPRYFSAKFNGKEIWVRIDDPVLARQMKKFGQAAFGDGLAADFAKVINKITRTLSSLYTQMNPEFILPNIFRDMQQGIVVATGMDVPRANKLAADMAKKLPASMKSAFKYHMGEAVGKRAESPDAKLYEQFRRDGGATGGYGLVDTEVIAKRLEHMINAAAGDKIARAEHLLAKPFKFVEEINNVFENTTRFAVYKAALEQGVSRQQAALIAKNITVNFNKHGETSPLINSLYAFFNASIQGNVALFRAVAKSRVAKAAALSMFSMGIAQELMGNEDETGTKEIDYVSDFKRDRSFVIPIGDGKNITLPLSYGLNVPFAMGRHLMRVIQGKENIAEGIGKSLSVAISTFLPFSGAWPTFVQPIVDVIGNKSFSDTVIYPKDPYDRITPLSSQSWKDTNKVYVEAAKALNRLTGGSETTKGFIDISANATEYLLRAYLGGIFAPIQAAFLGFSPKAKGINDVPIARRFVAERRPQFYSSAASKALNEIDVRRAEIEGGADPKPGERSYLARIESIEKQRNKLKRAKNKAEKRGGTTDAIERRIEELDKRIVTLANQYEKRSANKE